MFEEIRTIQIREAYMKIGFVLIKINHKMYDHTI